MPDPSEPRIELSMVVPVYNEEGSLRELVAELEPVVRGIVRAVPGSTGDEYEILFVDDGSTDGSPAVLAELERGNPRFSVWRLDRNHGLSSALHAGFNRARGALVGTLDADLQNDPKDLPKLVQAIRDGADMACGWRRDRQDPWVKRASSRVANWWRNRKTGSTIHDVTCPLKVFRREVREVFFPFHGLHRFLPTLAEMAGHKVVEIPVNHRPRKHGSSKYGVWNRVFRGMRDLRAIRWMQDRHMTYRAAPASGSRAADEPGRQDRR
jgi:glycosyltransferase involved in cell wall biosynthesis